jgi:hypothetical protein
MTYGELTPGKEIDCKCTRCKVVIGHTIVIMDGPAPKRVKCNSCGSEHRYIAAPEETGPARKPALKVRLEAGRRKEIRVEVAPSPTPAKTSSGKVARKRSPARMAPSTADVFVELIKDKELSEPRPYSPGVTFAVHELVEHPSFGQGIVVKVRGRKLDIHFRDAGPKVLVHTPE